MNPIAFVRRRPVASVVLLVALGCGGVLGASRLGIDLLPPRQMRQLHLAVDEAVRRSGQARAYLAARLESYLGTHAEPPHREHHKIVVTSPEAREVTLTQRYVCQIHSRKHIKIRALDSGFLDEILVREGQEVKQGQLMFQIRPILYQARLEAKNAEANLAQIEFENTEKLFRDKVVSDQEVRLLEAKLKRAQAEAKLAEAERDFTRIPAPFDGIVDRLHEQVGSLIKEGDDLTTLSDNHVMWVYFNVPEAAYLDYMAHKDREDPQIELMLANGERFERPGRIGAIEAKFNNQTGNIPFRADFENPRGLLRHGQTGNVLIHRKVRDAVVIPQRATFEVLDKRYVYVVGEDGVARQREIAVGNEMDDIFVVRKGLGVRDRIVLEGTREVRDGEKVDYEFRRPGLVMAGLKNRAE